MFATTAGRVFHARRGEISSLLQCFGGVFCMIGLDTFGLWQRNAVDLVRCQTSIKILAAEDVSTIANDSQAVM